MSDCIEWHMSKNSKGYGVQWVDGKQVFAHRHAYESKHGSIPNGLLVLHKCDNPPRVNVEHLFLGTHADNVRDKMSKGRHRNQSLTHCRNGHEFTEENTYTYKNHRECVECRKARDRNRYASKRLS